MRFPIIVLLVLAAGTTGCGGASTTAGNPTAPPEPTTAPIGGNEDPAGTRPTLPPARAVREGVEEPRPREFAEALVDETDGSLHVIYETGVEPCYVLGDVEVEEDDTQITVTLHEGFMADENGDPPVCIEIAEQVSTQVMLEAPVGDRLVVDGATGREVPVTVITAGEAPQS